MTPQDGTTGLVTEIQRFSIHDGPGIRTTVFFKGCPLACSWCHNPEAISPLNEPIRTPIDCIGCGDCAAACTRGALDSAHPGIVADAARCTRCLACAAACPSGACRPAGRAYDIEALLQEVSADRDFYGEEGGVTLSGGEPLIHAAFLRRLLPALATAGLRVAVQTCGHWEPRRVEPLLAEIDLLLFDVKAVDPRQHRQLTGRSNELILDNLRRVVARGRDRVQARVPLVGGCNDDRENLEQTARLLAELGLQSVTLLPYHPLGRAKEQMLMGRGNAGAGNGSPRTPGLESERLARGLFADHGLEVLAP